MPLRPGSGKEVVSQNISEFHTGKTYAHTAAKFGKEKANKQAIAVALSNARKYGKAAGGSSFNMENMVMRGSSMKLGREGMINSSIPGRTDKLPMKVQAGSYILPADIPSALGQGNTMAGGEILKKMFSSGPYGMAPMRGSGRGTSGPRLNLRAGRPPKGYFADGGTPDPNTVLSDEEAAYLRTLHEQRDDPPPPPPPSIRSFGPTGKESIDPNGQVSGFAKGGKSDDHVPIIAAGGEYIIHPDVVKDVGHGDIKKGHDVLDKFVLRVRAEHIKTLKKLPGPKR